MRSRLAGALACGLWLLSGCSLLLQTGDVRRAVENDLQRDVAKVAVESSTKTGKKVTVYMAEPVDETGRSEIEAVVRETVPDADTVLVVDGSSRGNHGGKSGDSRPNTGGDTRPNDQSSGDSRPNN